VLSGDSKLYIRAELEYEVDSLPLTLWLESSPDRDTTFNMTYMGDKVWHATLQSSKVLGLKSYNTVVAKTIYPDETDTTTWGRDQVDVALPKVEGASAPGLPTVYSDTIFIDHETMMLESDIGMRLRLREDLNGNEIDPNIHIDSVGYKYRTVWVANANRASHNQDSVFYRQYTADGSYQWWDGAAENCHVSFFRWNLYAVGGELTIEAAGALKPVPNIDNSFRVVTDSITDAGDSIKTMIVLIDSDPPNSLFEDYFTRDRIRAIAWREGAGIDPYPPHQEAYDPWNHYWPDTHTPCENRNSTATGIMQIVRTWWQRTFAGLDPSQPLGYIKANWDSLAWNWRMCIDNGTYIHDTYMPTQYEDNQGAFSDSCPYSDCGLLPKKKNKEDLKSFGYTAKKISDFWAIQNDNDWDNYIAKSNSREAQYVKDVRRYTYQKPWD
jgi:hypothetical protein